MEKRFTDTIVRNLQPKGKMYQERSAGEQGFGIRILPSGFKIWIFTYTYDGRRRQMNLGSYPETSLADARVEYSKAYAMLYDKNNPRDPQAERDQRLEVERTIREERRQHPTIAELAKEYINDYAKENKKSWAEDQRILNKDVVPVWGDIKTEDITRKNVKALIAAMKGRGAGIQNNTFKIIRRMFTYAVKQEYITTTPCYAFEKGDELPSQQSRERTLSEAEIKASWIGLDSCAMSPEIRSILKLILLTGQRPGEVSAMHRREIDGRWWEFTPKETSITKSTPRKQRIYLTDTALALIGANQDYIFSSPITRFDENENVIPTPITERAVTYALRRNLATHTVIPKPATWRKSNSKTKSKKPFKVAAEKKLNIEKFVPHDLRRSCATMLSKIGFSDAIVDAVLAHLKKGEIRTYNKNKYDKEKQQAMEAWERKFLNIITGTKGKVIPIKRKSV
jgi:integrase